MGLPALGQLVGPVAHALQPLARLQPGRVLLQALQDVVDATRAGEVGGEPGQPVIDDVRVGVVEAGQDGGALQVDDASFGPSQAEDLPAADRGHPAAGDREVAVRGQPAPSQRADLPARQDQFGNHRRLD